MKSGMHGRRPLRRRWSREGIAVDPFLTRLTMQNLLRAYSALELSDGRVF